MTDPNPESKEPVGIRDVSGYDLVDAIPQRVLKDPKKRKKIKALISRVEKNQGHYDDELVKDMKDLGVSRPSWIPKEFWQRNESLTPLEHIVCYMAAWGMTQTEISRRAKCSASFVSSVLSDDSSKDRIREVQEEIWGKNPKKWIESLLPDAINTAADIMKDPGAKQSVRLQAAEGFIDRALGKAAQKIEVNDSSMRKIIEKLDAIEGLKKDGRIEQETIEVEFEDVKTEEPEDEVDAWVKQNYQT